MVCQCGKPDWRSKLNDELSPEEITLKRQLYNLIIEIQEVVSKIKTIKFNNKLLCDCRVYRNPLKEIVTDVKEDTDKMKNLRAQDKKWSRDKHKNTFASLYGRYPGNTPESQKILSNKKEDSWEDVLDQKSFANSLEFKRYAKGNRVNSNVDITPDANRLDAGLEFGNVKGNEANFMNQPRNQSPTEAWRRNIEWKNNCFKVNVRPSRFQQTTKETRNVETNINTNQNENYFNFKLAHKREKEKHANHFNTKDINNTWRDLFDKVSPDDVFRSMGNKQKTIKNTNITKESNSKVDNVVSTERNYGESDDEKEKKGTSEKKISYNSRRECNGKYNQCVRRFGKNRQKFRKEMDKKIDINSYINSGLTSNLYEIPALIDEKYTEIFSDDSEEESQSDTTEVDEGDEEEGEEKKDEKDYRSLTNPLRPNRYLTTKQKASTKKNYTDRLINPDITIAKKSDKNDFEGHQVEQDSRSRMNRRNNSINYNHNVKHNYNVNYNRNVDYSKRGAKLKGTRNNDGNKAFSRHEKKIRFLEEFESDWTTIASEVDARIKSDSKLKKTADRCTGGTCDLSDTSTTSAKVKNSRQRYSLISTRSRKNHHVNSNVNVNVDRLIKPWRHQRKSKYTSQRFDDAFSDAPIRANNGRNVEIEVSAIRDGPRADKKKSLDVLIDAVSNVLPANTSSTTRPVRYSSKNLKGQPVETERMQRDVASRSDDAQ